MKKNKIYVFGNKYLKEDNLAWQIAQEIDVLGVEFEKCFDLTDLLEEEELMIMDVAKGILEVKVITDLKKIKTSLICSLHDFDLAYFLQIQQKMGILKKIMIIAIPIKGVEVEQVVEKINQLIL